MKPVWVSLQAVYNERTGKTRLYRMDEEGTVERYNPATGKWVDID